MSKKRVIHCQQDFSSGTTCYFLTVHTVQYIHIIQYTVYSIYRVHYRFSNTISSKVPLFITTDMFSLKLQDFPTILINNFR